MGTSFMNLEVIIQTKTMLDQIVSGCDFETMTLVTNLILGTVSNIRKISIELGDFDLWKIMKK